MAGPTEHGDDWVGCGGNFMGVFAEPYLDIPPTGHMAHMRFHEFYQFENDKITEMQAIWDIPELMMQAGAWPMVPSWAVNGVSLARQAKMASPLARVMIYQRDIMPAYC